MKCFYHGVDFDGKCAGAIVKLAHPECELIGIDYGDPFPWDRIQKGEEVWMVDFCLQPNEDMWRLRDACARLVWIDHHKTSVAWADVNGFGHSCDGLRRQDYSGCELTWGYIHQTLTRNVDPTNLPLAVRLLGRYDVWDHAADERVLPFQFGMRYLNPAADDVGVWQSLFDGHTTIEGIVERGLIVQQAQEQSHAAVCKMAGFDLEWEGLRWTAVNGPYRGSMVHKSRFDPAKHDAMLGFYWTGKQWMFSLTTDKEGIDVSEIAKRYGGGGHKGAAGFHADQLPFVLPSPPPAIGGA